VRESEKARCGRLSLREMIYIKSALVGLFTFFVATVVYVVSLIFILMRNYPVPPGVEVGFNLGSFVYRPSYWLIALAAFVIGFYLELRKGSG
jgi:hypothetical protein